MERPERTILIVEDERPLAEAIRIKLEEEGFSVVTARTVDQAEGYIKDLAKVDAIWLDHYLLGKKNGLDFVATLKGGDTSMQHIPIFVVSNTVGPEKVMTYMRLGVNKYYVKAEHRLADIIKDLTETIAEEPNV